MRALHHVRTLLIAAILCVSGPSITLVAQAATGTGEIDGAVTTQQGTIRLPGAAIDVFSGSALAAQAQAASDGTFHVRALPPGRYRIHASLDGFQAADTTVDVGPGEAKLARIDLRVAARESVTVTATATDAQAADVSAAPSATVSGRELDQFAPGGGFQEAMRLSSAVVDTPEGLSIKGGHPDEASVQLGPDSVVEPSTRLAPLMLPADAVESVSVLPNPYAVEFGRFLSGLIMIHTRRAADRWRIRVNDLDPDLRTKRSANFSVIGIKAFTPRLEIGGPLVNDRVFLEQAVQYNFHASDVPSLPETELIKNHWVSTFTRADVNDGPHESFVLSGGVFRNQTTDATLGTFVPPEASADIHNNMGHAAAVARSLLSPAVQSESTIGVQKYGLDALPHGSDPMVLQPDGAGGDFFNRQHRDTATYQFTQTFTVSPSGGRIGHAVKGGVDLLGSTYSGSSASTPVLIEDPGGRLVRRLDFAGSTSQTANSLDAAIFAEDRIEIGSRWVLQAGGRIDRDGTLDRISVTPRLGFALALNASGTRILRGGAGLFTDRTPLVARAFDAFQSTIDTRYAADGVTPLGAPAVFRNVLAPAMTTARSAVWSLNYEHHLNATWAWHAALLDRAGSHDLIVTPLRTTAGNQLLLSSAGRSEYRDAEAGVHFTHAPGFDVDATYIRSQAREDLNRFTTFFGPVLSPVIVPNAYGPASTDAPNRLFVRGRLQTQRWLVLGVVDWHTGFPYSIVDAALDVIGDRNSLEMPAVQHEQIGAERRVKIGRFAPWIGLRIDNPFNTFSPTDIQANVASPAFGALYNSDYRRTRLIVRFQR